MTRGNFLLITDTANWMSIQFNGDMYPSCNGKFVYHMLESVETYDDLAAAILKFDEERFGYADMHDADLAPASISDDIDFSKDYFAIYNSDYLYIKNASNKDCTIIAKNGVKQTIKPGEIQIWNYGNLVALDDEVLEELELDDNEKKFVCAGLAAAIEHCKLYSDTKSKMFITRNISTIMYNVFHTEPDGEQFMIGLIKDGVLTDTALRKMLSKMDKDTYLKNAVILKAYVINALSDIKCNFEL